MLSYTNSVRHTVSAQSMLIIVMHRGRKLLHYLFHKPDRMHVTKLNLNKGSPPSRPPSSCCVFLPVCLLQHTLPHSMPSACELSHTLYLISPLKNWVLRATVTCVQLHRGFWGLCAPPLMLLYSFETCFLAPPPCRP